MMSPEFLSLTLPVVASLSFRDVRRRPPRRRHEVSAPAADLAWGFALQPICRCPRLDSNVRNGIKLFAASLTQVAKRRTSGTARSLRMLSGEGVCCDVQPGGTNLRLTFDAFQPAAARLNSNGEH